MELHLGVRAMGSEGEGCPADLGEHDFGLSEEVLFVNMEGKRTERKRGGPTRMLHTVSSSRPRAAHSVCRAAEPSSASTAGPRAMLRISSPSSSCTPPSESLNLPLAGRPGVLYTVVLSAGAGPTGTAAVETDSRVVGSGEGKYMACVKRNQYDAISQVGGT